jgi:hypothetical protein
LEFSCSDSEYKIQQGEILINVVSIPAGIPVNFYPEDNFFKISNKNFKKIFTTGDKDNSEVNSSYPLIRQQFFEDLILDRKNPFPNFVNLSYLKDLRVTKMLC